MSTVAKLRKRRGVIRASTTRVGTRLQELEETSDHPRTQDHARQLLTKLNGLDEDFKRLHFELIDLIDEEDVLEAEQTAMDKHDDHLAELTVRLQALLERPDPPVADTAAHDGRKPFSRKLSRVQTGLRRIDETIPTSAGIAEHTLLKQLQEELSDYKKDLANLHDELVAKDLEDEDELFILHSRLERSLSDISRKVKGSLASIPTEGSPRSVIADGPGVKLPKLDVPTFDGNVVNWKQFWDQFSVAVHEKTNLSNAERIVYLQHAIKDGSARNAIQGLSHSGENYHEAVECLKARYDRPRLIHRTHVKMIVDALPLKEGSGKELRRLHDNIQQHVRALKTLGCELPGTFITSMVELKLDVDTLFEWQKHSQASADVPHFQDLLDFIDLHAQASETSCTAHKKQPHFEQRLKKPHGRVASFASTHGTTLSNCVVCKIEKHPLYVCTKFRSLPHSDKMSVVRDNRLCTNCLAGGHFVRQCKSMHKCKTCQKPHHTLLHLDAQGDGTQAGETQVNTCTAMKLKSNALLMTCRVLITAPDGSSVEARALLDNASSASFISERLANSLSLPRSSQQIRVSGIGGISHKPPIQSVASFQISPVVSAGRSIGVTAVVVPKVTCDLPLSPVPFQLGWKHIADLHLADPGFGQPGRIDILLGVDVYVDILRHGRRVGPPGSPTAFETDFGWVLCGSAGSVESHAQANVHITTFHTPVLSGDDVLRRFWEIEESPTDLSPLSVEERTVVRHFQSNHKRSPEGRFIVPLPKNPNAKLMGESREQAVRRFLSLERSLKARCCFDEFDAVMQEYLDLGHAERLPAAASEKPPDKTFYMPMHAVYKASSTTTKVRAVFDASAKSSTGVSLNDTLLVGPTVHPPLLDVLLQFRLYPVALTADISKMYRAVELVDSDRDLHRFVWRSSPEQPLQDYRMTRLTFGVSASSFAANMAVKQNAIDHSHEYPLAAETVQKSFYVDDCLTGATDAESALILQQQLADMFERGGFILRKWNSNDPCVLRSIPEDLRDPRVVQAISEPTDYTKTLGIQWNVATDQFRITVANLSPCSEPTKRVIVSDVARVYDVLGWFSPVTVKMKILLQRLWEIKVGWDDPVPQEIRDVWSQWRYELPSLEDIHVPRCYSPAGVAVASMQLHGFSDASEEAYGGVVYLRLTYSTGATHTALVISKTKVSPIKRVSIPRLELCGAQVLTKLLCHVKRVLHIPMDCIFAWTDSTIVLSWLDGSPRRFKTYVGNRISFIIDQIPPDRWRHVPGVQNPADLSSRGLFPAQIAERELWWKGPPWLCYESSLWPVRPDIPDKVIRDEEKELCHLTLTLARPKQPFVPFDRYSSFTRLKRVTAWVLRFVNNSRALASGCSVSDYHPHLTVRELVVAESFWMSLSQQESFPDEFRSLEADQPLPKDSNLLPFRPFLDKSHSLLRVGGRMSNSKLSYSRSHPIILHGNHPIAKLIIQTEHLRLLHAGPTLLMSSLTRRYHIICLRKTVRSITRQCVVCKRHSLRPQSQLLGQLPMERATPAPVFERVGIDYAGPFQIKYGYVRKPTVVKAYMCLFVCLSVKAVHLEVVSNLTTEAFISSLRRFVARRGYPSLLWSDHGTNFVGAKRELKELHHFLTDQVTDRAVTEFCSSHNIEWKFIPERSPHFGGLWESAVKSVKVHLKRILSPVRLTYEEFSTVLAQIEACLNSRPLVPVDTACDDGVDVLTPGHFLVGRPLTALPDPRLSYRSFSLLRRWHLGQCLVRHFWQRWYNEYLTSINKYNKWRHPTRNIAIGDIVVLRESGTIPTKWPLARVLEVHPGKDGLVRVVTLRTSQGVYKRPVAKLAILIPQTD